MVGIFQVFGINFVFWTVVGILRFIFDTLQEYRKTSRVRSFANLLVASTGGIFATFLLIFLFFLGFNFFENANLWNIPANLAAIPLWIAAVLLGSYFAARLYIHEQFAVVSITTLSAIAMGTVLFFNSSVGTLFTPQGFLEWNIWIIFTVCAGILGDAIGRAVNRWEIRRDIREDERVAEARIRPEDVAVVIAAHNEELTIGATINSLLQMAPLENIYVGSDGSKDKTVEVVKSLGAHVDDIQPNRGKAGALTYVLQKNKIMERYKAVFFVDADLRLDKNFYNYALPQLDDPKVVAVIGHAVSLWPRHILPKWRYFFTAYRIRLWRVLQYCLRYGQTWKYTNVSPIVPGGGSMYRTSALKHIQINTPGLIIEDFNMTFNIHHQKLGRISFDPRAFVLDQEPFSLHDYTKQVKRWYIGYFQTVRHHGLWPSWFCLSTNLFTLEMIVSSIVFLITPILGLWLIITGQDSMLFGFSLWQWEVTLLGIAFALLFIDYVVTIVVVILERKPLLLLYGIGFIFLRYVEAVIFLQALFIGLFSRPKTDGKWKSPKRVAYTSSAQG
ncbi:MAG TPA: glycosyltransferase family 2 protein [Candidatus Paceibacterota bacterium]|nr:glycosyltransferase family 2 protein [Candidatus Paceibacterota bacterium]